MKTIPFHSGHGAWFGLVAGLLCWAGSAHGVTFSPISPSIVSDTYADLVILQIDGLTNGETVVIDKYLDANTNGAIDDTDWLVQSFRLTDGQVNGFGGATNINIPYDSNSTNGSITAKLDFFMAGIEQRFVGTCLFRLSSPTNRFAALTNSFSVTHTPYAQGITGKVQCNGTNVPYAGILTFASSSDGGPIAETVADGSGTYTVKVAPGAYTMWAFKSNYVFDTGETPLLAVNASTTVTNDLNLISATCCISGRFVDATNTSMGLPGIFAMASSGNLFVFSFTDTNGNFTLPVTEGLWDVSSDDQEFPSYGYLRLKNSQPLVDTTTGNKSVTNAFPRGTALFYGTVTDDQNHPLSGVSLWAVDEGRQYEGDVMTDSNGNYAVAVLAGNWGVEVDPVAGIIFSEAHTNITDGQAVRVDFKGSAITTVSGCVFGGGGPVSGINVEVATLSFEGGDWHPQQSYGGDTDSNGNYSVTVPPGTNYYAWVNLQQGSPWLFQIYSNASEASGATVITALTNAPATNINFNLQAGTTVSGCVRGDGIPLAGIHVNVGTITIQQGGGWDWEQQYGGNDTDSNGNYSITVPPGTNYYVQANPNQGSPWLGQFYSNATDISGAIGVKALANTPATNINFNLQAGTTVSGCVRGDGVPLADIHVNVGTIAIQQGGGWNWTQQYGGNGTDSNGNYSITVPPGTNYYVQANPNQGSPWLGQFYSNTTEVSSATVIKALINIPATNINFNLQAGTTVSGHVFGNGGPVSGINVEVGTISFEGGGWHPQQSYGGNTDSNGNYSVTVPPGTNYYAWVHLQQGSPWLFQIYSNATDASSATVIAALTNAPATNIDFNLRQGTTVSGCVRGGGLPLEGINVQVGTLIFNPGGWWDWQQAYEGRTDSNGYYSVIVPSGTNYYAQANPPQGSPWLQQLYSNVTDASSATIIAALTNAPATNINFNLQQNTPLQINTTSLPIGTNGGFYSQTLQASGGQPPYCWSIPGYSADPPPHLGLAPSGVLSGTLTTTPGMSDPFYVLVTDGAMNTADQILSLEIVNPPLVITNVALPNGTLGAPYSAQLSATGGQPPYTWQMALGSAHLPTNLMLNSSSGLIYGTPQTNRVAPFPFKVQVTDASFVTTNKVLSITINCRPVLSSPCWVTNRFEMRLTGASNQNYTVQMSTNLSSTNWISLFITNNITTNSFLLNDACATNKHCFYRIWIEP